MDTLSIDFETRSEVDLKERGVYNYASDITTQILMMGWAFNDEPVQVWLPQYPFPQRIMRHIKNGGTLQAFNAQFERLIWAYVLTQDFEGAPGEAIPNPSLRQWKCTAAQVRVHGLPGNLKDVGRCLELPLQKMDEGQRLLKQYSFPGHETHIPPDDLALMIEYCATDVEVERALSQSLRQPTDEEWEVFWANEEINDRGLPIDITFTRAAVKYGEAIRQEADARIVKVTGGAVQNARARKTRDEWLRPRLLENHLEILTDEGKIKFGKPLREALLACDDLDSAVEEFTIAVEEAGGATISKYEAFTNRAFDDRLCGALLFSGGGQTGRFSSLGVQVHNLKREGHKNPEAEIQRILAGEEIQNPSNHLAKLIRAAIYHPDGLVWVDYSNIEGRVAPWLAKSTEGEKKLDVFRSGKDPYKVNAALMYSVSYDEVNDEQRQAGKVAELACFAKGTLVVTDHGLKAIETVKTSDLLWDGEAWVQHEGPIYKGIKETISLHGFEVTPDHLVDTQGTWLPARLLASNEQLMRRALAHASRNSPLSEMSNSYLKAQPKFGTYPFSVHVGLSHIWSTYIICSMEKVQGVINVLGRRLGFGEKITTHMPIFAQIPKPEGVYSIGYPLLSGVAPNREILCTTTMGLEESEYAKNGQQEKRVEEIFFSMSSHWTGMIMRPLRWIGLMLTKVMNLATLDLLRDRRTVETKEKSPRCSNESTNLKPVYDILNCGSKNKFLIANKNGELLVHNCGFLGGSGALMSMAKMFKMPMTKDRADILRDAWREVNKWAVPFGYDLVQAAKLAYEYPGSWFDAGRIAYGYDGQMWLWCRLPSGRLLAYLAPKMELVMTPWGDEVPALTAVWTGGKPKKGEKWPRRPLTPGLLLENSTQATAACILRRAIVRAVADGVEVVGHVHDEIIAQNCSADRLLAHLLDAPEWADGLPIEAVASKGRRYGK